MTENTTGGRTTEQMLADTEEQLRVGQDLPAQMAQVTGRAADDQDAVRITANAHGAVVELDLSASAMDMDPQRLGEAIVAVTKQATTRARAESVTLLSSAFGDDVAAELAAAIGLPISNDAAQPPAPEIVNNVQQTNSWAVIGIDPPVAAPEDTANPPAGQAPTSGTITATQPDDKDIDLQSVDFSTLRSDH